MWQSFTHTQAFVNDGKGIERPAASRIAFRIQHHKTSTDCHLVESAHCHLKNKRQRRTTLCLLFSFSGTLLWDEQRPQELWLQAQFFSEKRRTSCSPWEYRPVIPASSSVQSAAAIPVYAPFGIWSEQE
jgi:hypothetical protein